MKAYATSTAQIIVKMENATNPVTRASYRTILGNRIDRAELFRISSIKRLDAIEKKLNIQTPNLPDK